jgi:ABC-type transport system involved in multi-copper enzyme maturation permease subunit
MLDTRLVRAELFKLRTTSVWWLFAAASMLSTAIVLVVNMIAAHSLLKPFADYLYTASHGHPNDIPTDFLSHIKSEYLLGHSGVTQASTLYTSSELVGLLLACLLGVVIVTSEYQQQTATSTFLVTPRRGAVLAAKLVAAVVVAAAAWVVTTLLCLVAGAVFLHVEGVSAQLAQWGVIRSMLLNLAAYVVWAALGVGFGAVVRSQLAATVSATVLYLVGTAAAATVFETVNTYLIQRDWVLAAQVVMPSVASAVMISPTKTFDQSPSQLTGGFVLIAYGLVFALWGVRSIRRRDVA